MRILYESHYDALLIISQRITLDLCAAEEIVQNIFTTLWTVHRRQHTDYEPIQYELVRLVRRKSLKAYKRRVKLMRAREDVLDKRWWQFPIRFISNCKGGVSAFKGVTGRRERPDRIQLVDKALSGLITRDEQLQLNELNQLDPRFKQEFEDVLFIVDNVPELPDEYALDDNFYYGFRQIEHSVNGIRRGRRRLSDVMWKGLIVLIALLGARLILSMLPSEHMLTFGKSEAELMKVKPGQNIHLDDKGHARYTGTLSFSSSCVEHVFESIEHSFNVKIERINVELPERRFTGTIHLQGSIDDVLETLCLILELRICRKSKGTYVISGAKLYSVGAE